MVNRRMVAIARRASKGDIGRTKRMSRVHSLVRCRSTTVPNFYTWPSSRDRVVAPVVERRGITAPRDQRTGETPSSQIDR